MKTNFFYDPIVKTVLLFWFVVLSAACEKKSIDKQPDNTIGKAIFYISTDLGLGNITVEIDGKSSLISGYNSSSPDCGNDKSANFDLEEGTHSFVANASGWVNWKGTIIVTAGQCSKMRLYSAGGNLGNTGGTAKGQAIFWIKSDLGCGNVAVTCNGVTKSIRGFNGVGAPTCGSSGPATFEFPVGTYSFSAQCGAQKWNGSVTIASGVCNQNELVPNNPNPSSTGQVTFWSQSDLKCGNVNVTCNGVTRTISSFYISGAPSCGANGAATFNLPPGTYAFSASCTGKKWEGSTVTVKAGGCSKMELY